MNARPRSVRTLARVDGLLAAADRDVAHRREAYESAKAARRRARRLRAAARRRSRRASAPRAARTVLRFGLVLGGFVAFVAGLVAFLLGRDGSTELLSAAGAAWGLAAGIPDRRPR